MIIPMKKITLLCLEQDKTGSLEQLRRLGIMQLTAGKTPETADVAQLSKTSADIEKAINLIRMAEEPEKKEENTTAKNFSANGCKIVARTLELAELQSDTQKELEALRKEEELLLPWGDFSPASLQKLKEQNIHITFCISLPAQFEERKNALPDNVTVKVISVDKRQVCYILISPEEPAEPVADSVQLPAKSLNVIRETISDLQMKLHSINAELVTFKAALPQTLAYQRKAAAALEFASARDGMNNEGALSWICGFVPVTELEKLRKAALDHGWALQIEDPGPDDEVPTYIKKPAFLNIMDPLFDFIGVQPGYRENDVNAFFLVFFPIFFGMILGDAGYAVLFLGIAMICKQIFRNKPAARLPLNLFILLSCASLIWGWLNGSWLGIPKNILPGWMSGWSLLADPANNETARNLAQSLHLITPEMGEAQRMAVYSGLSNKFVQFFCFFLAALHLGSARIFKFVDEVRYSWLAVGNLGWGCLIVANFLMATNLIVFPGTFPKATGFTLYGVGIVLILITTRGVSFMNLPFALINSFVDVLSYIRLFAVGLSGAYIAENFNKMGVMLMDTLPGYWVIAGVVLLILVALVGHILNIALGFLGVMVHGIRLNTLEFSNHVGMQWEGIKFRPFANPENTETNNIKS